MAEASTTQTGKANELSPSLPAAYVMSTTGFSRVLWLASSVVVTLGLLRAVHVLVDPAPRFTGIFDFDREQTLPAWYSSMLMIAASALLAVLAFLAMRTDRRSVLPWAALSAIFVYLSLDEALSLHEQTIHPTIALLGLPPKLHFLAWPIAYLPPLVAFLVFVLPFVRRVPLPFRNRMIFAGLIFVGGAFGMEFVGGVVFNTLGIGIVSLLLICVEETMEIAGMTLFVAALAGLVAWTSPTITVAFDN
jgi:hypothetical protein